MGLFRRKSGNETGTGVFARLKSGLSRTSERLVGRFDTVFSGRTIDENILEDLEELLVTADVGVHTTTRIIENISEKVSRKTLKNADELKEALKTELRTILDRDTSLSLTGSPSMILVLGVNGVGKTTSVAKLAHYLKGEGRSVMLAAGDTFRAGAIEQLKIWGERAGVPVVSQGEGSDPAAVVFDAASSAKAKGTDVLIADTAGRLHTKTNLMEELKKIIRVTRRELPEAPHETLLVLDATSGQNAISQAKLFSESTPVSGIILTKLDGTAKGGVIVGIVGELGIPVKFIGIGETMDDLRPFDADAFVEALFSD